jgi:plastocyanin
MSPRRLAALLTATVATSLGLVAALAQPAGAAPATYTVGVDNGAPPGHNWEYTDFFPANGVDVHNGDVLHFAFSNAAPDSLHTATVLPAGQTGADAWASTPFLIPDADDPGSLPLQNPAVFDPSLPPPGSGAPGACGDAAAPCPFDGATALNSGAQSHSDYFTKINLPSGTTGKFIIVCLIHPGMQTTVNVVAGGAQASTQAQLDAQAAADHQAFTAEALAAEAAATATVTPNPDGTRTITAHAGVATPHVQLDEMLPADLPARPGDKVTWLAAANNVHTVTFPRGSGSNAVDPFAPPPECENGSAPDTPATGPPPTGGCAGGAPALEFPLDVAAHGPTSILAGGYRTGASDGGVFNFGNSPFLGSAAQFHPEAPIISTQSLGADGYYQFGTDGGVFTFGTAAFFGSAAGKTTAPVGAALVDPSGAGYLLIGRDGSTYPFDANLPPDLGPLTPGKLAAPIVGADTSEGLPGFGFWAVSSDGGVFAVGAAPFLGSAVPFHPAKPIVGMAATPDGGGYYLVAADGGVFTFGTARFLGSLGATRLNAPIVGIAVTPDGGGYYLVAADGGVFAFGTATFAGSTGALKLVAPMTSISLSPGTVATSGVLSQPPAPLPSQYSFSFPEKGTFAYQCRIHDHMVGVVSVG